MNNYKKQGKGRNPSPTPKTGMSGLARTLLARNDITCAVLPEQDAPHTAEPPRSLREDRRHHGGQYRIDPLRIDPLLGPNRRELQTVEASWQAEVRRALPPLDPLLDAFGRLRRQVHDAVYHTGLMVSPTGRLVNGHNRAAAFAAAYGAGPHVIDSLSQLQGTVTGRMSSRDHVFHIPRLAGRSDGRLSTAMTMLRSRRDNQSQRLVLLDLEGGFSRMTDHWTALGRLFEGGEKANREAQEKAEIEERLAGRKPGDVIRRPRRTVAGISVFDEVQPDGHIARKVVQPQRKE